MRGWENTLYHGNSSCLVLLLLNFFPGEIASYFCCSIFYVQVESIQQTLGVADHTKSKLDHYTNDAKSAAVSKMNEKPGIDVVLGSQWGDEGKGKLVDMLSQVGFIGIIMLYINFHFMFVYSF